MVGFKKTVKKYAVKARRAVQNRYFYKKSKYMPKIGQMASDVAKASKLVQLLNVEKKRINGSVISTNVASTSGAGTGAQILAMWPAGTFSQGTSASTINGQSIKITSCKWRFRITQQSALVSALRYKVEFFEVLGATAPSLNLTTLNQIYQNDPISGYVDYNSERNPDYLQNYRKIHTFKSIMPADNYAGIANYTSGMRWIYGGKKTRHVRFDSGLNILNNNVVIVFTADIGDVPGNTGITIQHYLNTYYVDN